VFAVWWRVGLLIAVFRKHGIQETCTAVAALQVGDTGKISLKLPYRCENIPDKRSESRIIVVRLPQDSRLPGFICRKRKPALVCGDILLRASTPSVPAPGMAAGLCSRYRNGGPVVVRKMFAFSVCLLRLFLRLV